MFSYLHTLLCWHIDSMSVCLYLTSARHCQNLCAGQEVSTIVTGRPYYSYVHDVHATCRRSFDVCFRKFSQVNDGMFYQWTVKVIKNISYPKNNFQTP